MSGPLANSNVVAGRYIVESYVGAGGMQWVYLARDKLLNRFVALKTPKEDKYVKKFVSTARLSASVNHPNVAKTLDYIEEAGRSFLIEEYIEGADLSKVIVLGPRAFPPSACARFLARAARGLAASHRVGIVHRDLKPSNIMVVGGLSFSNVKITDFGIAKLAQLEIDDEISQGILKTKSSTVFGAIPYLAPESIDPNKRSGMPSDVWALGAITYELMSGTPPFGKTLAAIASILGDADPAVPLDLAAPAFRETGNELFEIIKSCLNRKPEERPTAEDLFETMRSLCYSDKTYECGNITGSHPKNRNYWFISSENGQAGAHRESFYALDRQPAIGDSVWFARNSGYPGDRAFPIAIVAKPSNE